MTDTTTPEPVNEPVTDAPVVETLDTATVPVASMELPVDAVVTPDPVVEPPVPPVIEPVIDEAPPEEATITTIDQAVTPPPISVVDGPPLSQGVGEMPAPDVVETLPDPGQVVDEAPVAQGPVAEPDPSVAVDESPPPVPPEVTAVGVTELIPPPVDLAVDQPIEKPLTDEQVQNVRNQMPADVEQVIRNIAKEAALEAINETVIAEVLIDTGLPEPGQPSS